MIRVGSDLAEAAERLIEAEIAGQELQPDEQMTVLQTIITHGDTGGTLLTVTYRIDALERKSRTWTATYAWNRSPAPAPTPA